MEPNNDFLPAGYEQPKTGGNYMKLKSGENKFRILSKPIIGWLDWQDKKPLRFAFDNKPLKSIDPTKPVKHFWAFVVWNYQDEQINVLELTQSSIQGAIKNLSADNDWGSPFEYDIKIIKTGEKMETEYKVNPIPHKPLADEIKKAFSDKPCNLNALFTNDDPFEKIATSNNGSDLPF